MFSSKYSRANARLESIQYEKLKSNQNAVKKRKKCFQNAECTKLCEYKNYDEMSKNLNRQGLDSTQDEKIFSITDAGYESEGGNDSAEDKVFDVELHSCIPKWDTEEKILDDENKI